MKKKTKITSFRAELRLLGIARRFDRIEEKVKLENCLAKP